MESLTESEGIPGTCRATHARVGEPGVRAGPTRSRPGGTRVRGAVRSPPALPEVFLKDAAQSEGRLAGPAPRASRAGASALGRPGAAGPAPPASPAWTWTSKRGAARWAPGAATRGRGGRRGPRAAAWEAGAGSLTAGSARRLRRARERLCGAELAHRGDPAADKFRFNYLGHFRHKAAAFVIAGKEGGRERRVPRLRLGVFASLVYISICSD